MSKKNKLRPLKYYINDKEEMMSQVFSCISEKQIQKMTPAILKEMSIEELKAECLVHLLTMSNETILNVLEGRKCINKDNEKTSDVKLNNCAINNLTEASNKNANSEIISSPDNKTMKTEINEVEEEEANKSANDKSEVSADKSKKIKKKKHKNEKKKKKDINEETESNDVKGKNLLELLELEMRAKAIRSLLKQEEELEKLKEQNLEPENRTMAVTKDECPQRKKGIKSETGLKRKKIIAENKMQKKHHISLDSNDVKNPNKKLITDNAIMKKENITEICIIEKKTNAETDEIVSKKDHFNWSTESEKLIYEDDDCDSDIKTKDEENKEQERSDENSRSSWAERWLQSKDVKRVVATSKMLSMVRNKMKNNNRASSKQIRPPITSDLSVAPVKIEGSVKEYDTLQQLHDAARTLYSGQNT